MSAALLDGYSSLCLSDVCLPAGWLYAHDIVKLPGVLLQIRIDVPARERARVESELNGSASARAVAFE
jgi:hypothetical protein